MGAEPQIGPAQCWCWGGHGVPGDMGGTGDMRGTALLCFPKQGCAQIREQGVNRGAPPWLEGSAPPPGAGGGQHTCPWGQGTHPGDKGHILWTRDTSQGRGTHPRDEACGPHKGSAFFWGGCVCVTGSEGGGVCAHTECTRVRTQDRQTARVCTRVHRTHGCAHTQRGGDTKLGDSRVGRAGIPCWGGGDGDAAVPVGCPGVPQPHAWGGGGRWLQSGTGGSARLRGRCQTPPRLGCRCHAICSPRLVPSSPSAAPSRSPPPSPLPPQAPGIVPRCPAKPGRGPGSSRRDFSLGWGRSRGWGGGVAASSPPSAPPLHRSRGISQPLWELG